MYCKWVEIIKYENDKNMITCFGRSIFNLFVVILLLWWLGYVFRDVLLDIEEDDVEKKVELSRVVLLFLVFV